MQQLQANNYFILTWGYAYIVPFIITSISSPLSTMLRRKPTVTFNRVLDGALYKFSNVVRI